MWFLFKTLTRSSKLRCKILTTLSAKIPPWQGLQVLPLWQLQNLICHVRCEVGLKHAWNTLKYSRITIEVPLKWYWKSADRSLKTPFTHKIGQQKLRLWLWQKKVKIRILISTTQITWVENTTPAPISPCDNLSIFLTVLITWFTLFTNSF